MEYLNAYDEHDNLVGKIERDKAHSPNPGAHHKAVWIWIINKKGEILVQQRAQFKQGDPLKWDFPSAGHVDAGEDLLDTCVRETQEELGITLPKNKFEYLFQWRKTDAKEFGETFIAHADIKIADMKLDPREVAQVKWLNFDEFKQLFYSPDFVPHATEYKNKMCEILDKSIETCYI